MNGTNPKVDGFLRASKQWREELQRLRLIVFECGLTEEVKWRVPCYTFQGSNVVLLGRLKDCCVLSFVRGALLKDADGILAMPGPNTQSARVARFTDVRGIVEKEPVLKAYIQEAIEVQRSGLKVDFAKPAESAFPLELQDKFGKNPRLRAAFGVLTPGRQRAYILYFSAAKQAKTRLSRIEKCEMRILDGKGLDDQ